MKITIIISVFIILIGIASAEEIQKKIYVDIDNETVEVYSKDSEKHKFLCSYDNLYKIYLPIETDSDWEKRWELSQTEFNICEDERRKYREERDKEIQLKLENKAELERCTKEKESGENCEKRIEDLKESKDEKTKILEEGITTRNIIILIQGFFLLILIIILLIAMLKKFTEGDKK